MASRSEIKRWFDQGVGIGQRFMLVVCDTFDYTDFPVYLLPGSDAREEVKDWNSKKMLKVMECYDLNQDRDSQLSEGRVWNYGEGDS